MSLIMEVNPGYEGFRDEETYGQIDNVFHRMAVTGLVAFVGHVNGSYPRLLLCVSILTRLLLAGVAQVYYTNGTTYGQVSSFTDVKDCRFPVHSVGATVTYFVCESTTNTLRYYYIS